MKSFLQEHIRDFQTFCTEQNISLFKALYLFPKCYNDHIMLIQNYDGSNATKGLTDNTPAEILLTIKKNKDNIDCELTQKGRELLSISRTA